MSAFERIEGAKVILIWNGIYSEADLYQFSDRLFAKIKSGYIRLLGVQLTTNTKIRWDKIVGVNTVETPFGPRLITAADLKPAKQAKKPARKTSVKSRKPTLDKSGRQLSA